MAVAEYVIQLRGHKKYDYPYNYKYGNSCLSSLNILYSTELMKEYEYKSWIFLSLYLSLFYGPDDTCIVPFIVCGWYTQWYVIVPVLVGLKDNCPGLSGFMSPLEDCGGVSMIK